MFFCGSKSVNTSGEKQVRKYINRFRFTEVKLRFYIDTFYRIGNSKFFTKEQFRENMGLLGLESTCLISDRIFSVMSHRGDKVRLRNYLEYMDILLYGTPEEKAEQSFKLITESDGITFEDFVDWLVSMWKMYNSLTGYEINTSAEDINKYFVQLDRNNDRIIDLQEYKEAMSQNKSLYEWFEFANRGIKNQDDDEDDIEMDKWAYERSLDLIEKDLKECIEMLRDNRRSVASQASRTQRLSNRVSLNLYEEDSCRFKEPKQNLGDRDLPDESEVSAEAPSNDFIDKSLFEILASVKQLKEEGDKRRASSHHRSNSESSVSFT